MVIDSEFEVEFFEEGGNFVFFEVYDSGEDFEDGV